MVLKAGQVTKASVGLTTLEWVSLFNRHKLPAPIGYVPPADAHAEAFYYRQHAERAIPA